MARLLARDAGAAPGPCAVAVALWGAMRFDAADPFWPDRDRCVVGAGEGTALLPAVLRLTGHPSDPAAEAEGGAAPAEASGLGVAPPGFALATAAGMALAERMLAAHFGRSLVDHRSWVLATGTELDGSLSQEAASLAAELRLDRLTVLHDVGDGPFEERLRRFAALGWTVRLAVGEAAVLATALSSALGASLRGRKPTLIACRADPAPSTIPPAAPSGALPATGEVASAWIAAGRRGAAARRGWLKRLARHAQRGEFERVMAGRLPEHWNASLVALRAELAQADPPPATERVGQLALDALAAAVPELLAGFAGPEPGAPSAATGPAVGADAYAGRFVPWGVREGGMAAAMNGMALHGGLIPSSQARFAAGDGMRPALHLAAMLRRRVVHVLLQDDEAAGAAFHMPAGQLASLRAVPDLHVMRPADAVETAECWELALRRAEGPSLLVLSGRPAPTLRRDAGRNRCAQGGYVLAGADGIHHVTLIASGPELAVVMAARAALAAEGIGAAVVSLPCWELFGRQDESYRAAVLGEAPRFAVEAAQAFGWERWLGQDGVFIGPDDAAQASPRPTAETVRAAVRRTLGG